MVYCVLVFCLVYFFSVFLLFVMWCLRWCGLLVVECRNMYWVVRILCCVYDCSESCLIIGPVWCRWLAYFPFTQDTRVRVPVREYFCYFALSPLISLIQIPFPIFYKSLITNNIYILSWRLTPFLSIHVSGFTYIYFSHCVQICWMGKYE